MLEEDGYCFFDIRNVEFIISGWVKTKKRVGLL